MKIGPRVAHVYLRLFREGLRQSWLGVASAIGCSFLSLAIIGAVFVAIGQGVGSFTKAGDSAEAAILPFSTLLLACLGIALAIMLADVLAYLSRKIARHVGRKVSVSNAQKALDGLADGTCSSLSVFTNARELTASFNRSLRLSGIAMETIAVIIEAAIGVLLFGILVFEADPVTGVIALAGSLLTIPAVWGLQKKIRDSALKYYTKTGTGGRGSISRLIRTIDSGQSVKRNKDGSVELPSEFASDMLDDFDAIKLASARTRFASSILQAVVLFAVMLSLAWQISDGELDMAHATVAVLALLKLSQTCKGLASTGALLSRYFSMLGPFDTLLEQLDETEASTGPCQLDDSTTTAGFTLVAGSSYALDSETPVGKISKACLASTLQSGFEKSPGLGRVATVSRQSRLQDLESSLAEAECIFASMHASTELRTFVGDRADTLVFWCSEGRGFDRSGYEHVLVVDDKGKAEWDSDFRRVGDESGQLSIEELEELMDDE